MSLKLNELKATSDTTIVILGAPDDLGVKLNRGRLGAADGPDAAREAFYKFALPESGGFSSLKFIDIGNIQVVTDITRNHKSAQSAASAVGRSGATLIALGGGHDYAAPHALGFFEGVAQKTKRKRFGVINIDPHLDVRELENNLPHSGTAFRQIIESGVVKGSNMVQFGARVGRNSKKHFDFCSKSGVHIITFDEIRRAKSGFDRFKTCLGSLSKRVDKIAVSLDIDSCSDVEGASAAAVIGFTAWELCQFAYLAGRTKNVGAFEIAELAPSLDKTGRSARIAAEIIFHFSLGLADRLSGRG